MTPTPLPDLSDGPSAGWIAALAGGLMAVVAVGRQLWTIGNAVIEIKTAAGEVKGIKSDMAGMRNILVDHGNKLDIVTNSVDAIATAATVVEGRKAVWMDSVGSQLDKLRAVEAAVEGILTFRKEWLARQEAEMAAVTAKLARLTPGLAERVDSLEARVDALKKGLTPP